MHQNQDRPHNFAESNLVRAGLHWVKAAPCQRQQSHPQCHNDKQQSEPFLSEYSFWRFLKGSFQFETHPTAASDHPPSFVHERAKLFALGQSFDPRRLHLDLRPELFKGLGDPKWAPTTGLTDATSMIGASWNPFVGTILRLI